MDQGTMATPHNSTVTSPTNAPFPQDLFPLDFLSFVESTSPSNNTLNLGQPDFTFQSDGGPSTSGNSMNGAQHSYHSSPAFDFDSRSNAAATPDSTRGGSSRGRGGKKGSKRGSISSHFEGQQSRNGGHDSQRGMQGMDVDNQDGKHLGGMEEATRMAMASQFGLQGLEGMEGLLDGYGHLPGLSQGMLQQFEGIHMQSPIVFDPNNPSQPYNPMAQFLANSPNIQQGEGGRRKMSSVNMVGGLITPGASGDMFPQIRQDQMMSPMQLEMLSRRDQMEAMQDLNMAPLLSPALNNNAFNFTSPSNNAAFQSQSPLEALQEQQRQFQEQLNALQVQQRQLQATAAAVAAQSSPFLKSGSSSGQTRSVPTPGMMGSTEPSPQFFSPLTSPALEATRQYNAFNNPRPPHPLSALSSPALNPLGSSGGAQQTLSPALNPQAGGDLSDPDYLRALVGMLDNTQTGLDNGNMRIMSHHHQQQQQQPFQSPHLYSSHQSSPLTPNQTGLTPLLSASGSSNGGPTAGTGPHRQSLPAKSRPSPLVKPVNHRSHMRHPSTHTSFSQPSSPAVLRGIQPGTYLPAAAMDNRVNQGQGLPGTGSLASTPSPVDLASIMPPPPVPSAQKGLTPMTPAALMNLGGGAGGRKQVLPKSVSQGGIANETNRGATGSAGPSQGRGLTRKVSVNGGGLPMAASSAGAAGTPASTKKGTKAAGAKRLAAKVPGVGVRAATKGAAAAAALNIPVEGETRRTSHKAAEQKRRDSLKAGFDELRLLLPPINTEALDPESGEPIPGSSAPRLLPKSSLVPDDNPNRGVSKVALLKFSNEYIVKLHEKVDRRDKYLERLRSELGRLRAGGEGEEGQMEDGQDLLEFDITLGEEEEDEQEVDEVDEEEEEGDEEEEDEGMMEDDDLDGLDEMEEDIKPKKAGMTGGRSSGGLGGRKAARRPVVGRRESSGSTVTGRSRRGE